MIANTFRKLLTMVICSTLFVLGIPGGTASAFQDQNAPASQSNSGQSTDSSSIHTDHRERSGEAGWIVLRRSEDSGSKPLGKLSDFATSPLSPLGPGEPQVLDGYSLRILSAQGDKATGGAKTYVVNGKMTGGYAVLASPVTYRKTGVMTFIVGKDGVVYQQDLGEKTSDLAAAIKDYNPTDAWKAVE
jgi:Protein of unknown function (DUF2950)